MRIFRYAPLLSALILILTCSGASFAAENKSSAMAGDFRITRHEPLNNLVFEDAPAALAQKAAPGKPRATPTSDVSLLSFEAYGRRFNLELEPNDALFDNLPQVQKYRLKQSIKISKGRIPGIKGSWARISRSGDRISGAVWDGNELYLIDSSDEIGKALAWGQTARSAAKPYPLIYKVSDIESSATCAVDPNTKAFSNYRGLVKELTAQALALPQASRKLDVAIVADAQFTQANSANPQAAVVARMNVVDGIYSEQVGVYLNISEIRALTSNGGLSATDAGGLLDQFVTYAAAPGFNNPGLAHLFSGRDLNGSTVGIAYIGVLCRKDLGVGLSQTDGTGTAGALTVAHEMGHNFGAPHDNQSGSACSSTPGNFIMNPFLNGSTQFSSCSLQQMSPNVNQAACVTSINTTPAADVRPVIPVNPVNVNVSSNFNYAVEIRNGGTGTAQSSTAKITIPSPLIVNSVSSSAGQCTQSAGAVNCTLGNLAPNTAGTVTISLRSGVAPAALTSQVQAGAANDGNTGNNTVNVAINVRNPVTTSTIFQSDFNASNGGFTYVDDAFNATTQPAYSSGGRIINAGNGQLRVVLGGLDNATIRGMSGGWRRTFTLSAPKAVTLSFDYQLTQAANYEADEYSDALLTLDGRNIGLNGGSFLVRIAGDGVGGGARTSGLRHADVNLGTLPAGSHTLTLGGYNNKKTMWDESTQVVIDNVKAVSRP